MPIPILILAMVARQGANCSSDEQDNYAKNVLTFGQEYVTAQLGGFCAHYPVQSVADIMFALAHGAAALDQSGTVGIGYFRQWNQLSNTWDLTTIIPTSFSDHNQHGELSCDADWLAASSCSLLCDGGWSSWNNICGTGNIFKSVLGFRENKVTYVTKKADPNTMYPGFPDQLFWSTFIGYMENGVSGDEDIWEYQTPAQEKGVRCWMDAAWYAWDQIMHHGYAGHDTQRAEYVVPAAAVDGSHRYVLKNIAPRWSTPVYIIGIG